MYQGLSNSEALGRLKKFGHNELPTSKPKRLSTIVLEVIKEPMFLLLLSAGTIYILLGDYSEGVVLLSWVFIIIYITFYQHRKTERSLEALRQLSSPRALVIRDGQQQRIAGRDLVPDDIFILNEGDRVPADATILKNNHLIADESLLTGESAPVLKDSSAPNNQIYSGSMVVNGSCVARADLTGTETKFGKIGTSLGSITKTQTRLQSEIKMLIRNLLIAGILISSVVVIAFYLTRGGFLQSLLNGLAASMALLPEEFPVVLTIFLALGAWRLSKNSVLTRDPSAIETLGSTTVLCSDKTGTITKNEMIISLLWNGTQKFTPTQFSSASECQSMLQTLFFASGENSIDPMEKAVAEVYSPATDPTEIEILEEFNLSIDFFAMTRILKLGNKQPIAFCKGAPEVVFRLCQMTMQETDDQMQKLREYANKGYRVLAFASSIIKGPLPSNQSAIAFKYGGLVCFEDPIRDEVPQSIDECYKAGIHVIMITGDYPVTAKSIADQIGLPKIGKVITGPELDSMTDYQLREEIKTTQVFARIVPEQKMRIIRSLKANRHVVAMTGDGINDAPALKAADVGIAMGMKGTDVAREASSLVLLDDNFTSIVNAIRSGRRIYDNLEKAMAYIVAIHIPIIGLVLLPGFMPSLPVLLMPLHIVFMELIIDPACSIAFESEPEEQGIMSRPPRDLQKQFFGWRLMTISALKGLLLLGSVVTVFFVSISRGYTAEEVRAISFATLIIGNVIMIIHSLSDTRNFISVIREKNKALILITLLALSTLTIILTIPFLQDIFNVSNPAIRHYSLALIASLVLLFVLEGFKFIKNFKLKPKLLGFSK